MKNEKLVDSILTGDEVAEFRQASLNLTIETVRRRARNQRILRRSSLLAIVCASATALVLALFRTATPSVEGNVEPSKEMRQAGAASSEIKSISDDELLTLFPGKTVAIIGPPGQQRFVVFEN